MTDPKIFQWPLAHALFKRFMVFPLLLTFCILHPAFCISYAGIPEPETLIFGDVYNTSGGKRIVVTSGTVAWSLKGREGEANLYKFETLVECMDCETYMDGVCASCNDYGYRLAVPHEALASGVDPSGEAVPLTMENKQYDYLEVTVDGSPARLILMGQSGNARPDDPEGEFILASQNRRSHFYQVDLEVAEPPKDEDGDGMPDYWETENNLQPADPGDATLDPDDDGWTNLEEYRHNADPNQNNTIPSLFSDRVNASERGRTQFRLAILDSDTSPQAVLVELTSLPDGVALTVLGEAAVGDSGTQLVVGDVLTLRDMIEGNILLTCESTMASPKIGVSISDGDHDPLVADLTLSVFRPSDENGTDAMLWIDAAHFADGVADGESPIVLRDRSGRGFDGDAWHYADNGDVDAYDMTPTISAPSGRPVVSLDGTAWIELPYGENVFPGRNATFLAVVRPTGATDGVLSSGPYFEVGVTGADHPSHPNEIRVSTDSETVYSNRPVTDEWVIAGIQSEAGETRIFIDGLWTGGPQAHANIRPLGTDPVIGARTEWTWEFDVNDWVFQAHNVFSGDVGEILMFNRTLIDKKAWEIQAYLRSKWFGAVINDQSDATAAQHLMGASRAEWEKRKALVDAVYDAWQAYSEAKRADEDIDAALAAFEALVPDHAAWSQTPPAADDVKTAYETYRDATVFNYERDFVSRFGPEPSYVMLGGYAADDVAGGYENDLLAGGPGPDHLYGLGGKDLFVVGDGDEIYDFNRNDGDMIDISGILTDSTKPLSACVRLELVNDPEAEDVHTLMRIDANGDGSGFDDAEILLRSVVLRDTDLPGLWANGFLKTGGVRPQLSLSIEAASLEAMEIGGPPGVLSLSFTGGNAPADLTVPLTFSGDAEFGVDYRLEAMIYDPGTGQYKAVPVENGRVPVQLKPGDSILTVHLIPVADGENELVETARVGLMPKSEYYALGDPSEVSIALSDGPDEVRVIATSPMAHESGQLTGRVTVSRTGTVADPLMVRLSIQGTAINGTDYDFIPSEIQIPAGQVTTDFPIAAKQDAENEPEEYAEIFVIQDNGYVVAGANSVRVKILDAAAPVTSAEADLDGDGLPDEWELRFGFDTSVVNTDGDPDNDGFTNLEEHSCGTDPTDGASAPAPPLANAGPDRIVAPGEVVKLSALNSMGGNGEAMSVSWTQIGGPSVDLTQAQSARPSFTAPQGPAALTFEVTVTTPCGGAVSAINFVNVTSDGQIPVAVATAKPALLTGAGETATLNGSGSVNAAGLPNGLSHRWTQVFGPETSLSDPAAATTTFGAPVAETALVFELTVTEDATGLKARDRVAVNVSATNQPPEAMAFTDPNPAVEGAAVLLGADPGVSWRWRQIAGPPAALSDPTAQAPLLLAPFVGPDGDELMFEVAVMDDNGLLALIETGLSVNNDESAAADAGAVPVKLASGDVLTVKSDSLGLLGATPVSADAAPADALYDPVKMDVKSIGDKGKVTVSLPAPAPDGYAWQVKSDDDATWTFLDTANVAWNADRTAAELTLPGKGSRETSYQVALAPGTPDDGGDDSDDGSDDGSGENSGGGGGGCFIESVWDGQHPPIPIKEGI